MTLRWLTNTQVLTFDPRRPEARGVVVEDGVVRELVDEGEGPRGAERVDLGGAVLVPGLIDAHFHLRELGARDRELSLDGTCSAREVAARVAERAPRLSPGEWLDGFGWNETTFADGSVPHKQLLDEAAPGVPVFLGRIDFHAAWVSSAALALAGIDAHTPDPPGGSLGRNARGEPTGLLVDRAMDLVRERRGQPPRAVLDTDVRAGMARCVRAGLSCVHDMMLTPEVLELLVDLEARGELSVRVRGYLHGTWERLAPLLAERKASWAAPPGRRATPRLLEVRGVKLFTDGALGSRGAALYEPYCDCPTTRGIFIQTPEELIELAMRVHATGYQLAIHAIGDHANQVALDAIASAQGSDRSRRHRIEHAQILRADALPRFAALGVIASVQPTHCTSDMHMADQRLGAARLVHAYAWRSLTRAGAKLALGSDAPIEPENPWYGVHAAVTRQDRQGEPAGGFRAGEALTRDESLRGFMQGAAHAAHDEAALGVIAVGTRADFTLLADDPTRVAPGELHRVRPLGAVVDGRMHLAREGTSPLAP